MNLENRLRRLKREAQPRNRDHELERALEYFRRLEQPPEPRKLPAQRVDKGIEEYVDGEIVENCFGQCFLARETFPFGRPYGKLRVGDVATADLKPLKIFVSGVDVPEPSKLIFLDTETTGLAGGTGTCAFLVGVGFVEGMKFVVRQYFLRDYPEEKALLHELAGMLETFEGVVTYNGKTFDLPLLETRYVLSRMKSPLPRLIHLDALHPARRLWKLRLETCKLTDLESAILGIQREGDIPGSEIPGIYFDYLRSGDARGLQPVFYHNALDILTLAAVTVQLSRALADGGTLDSPVDLFSLSRIQSATGAREKSVATCQRAIREGLPQPVESQALRHLALQLKRQRQHDSAVDIWLALTRRELPLAIEALEELAIYYEHRQRDARQARHFTVAGLERLRGSSPSHPQFLRFTHRLERLDRKLAREANVHSNPFA